MEVLVLLVYLINLVVVAVVTLLLDFLLLLLQQKEEMVETEDMRPPTSYAVQLHAESIVHLHLNTRCRLPA